MQVQLGVWRRTELAEPWVIGPKRVRRHHYRCPALHAKFKAEGVPLMTFAAENEDRVGVPQWINLRSDVDRQSADHSADQQQANAYHPSSNAATAARIIWAARGNDLSMTNVWAQGGSGSSNSATGGRKFSSGKVAAALRTFRTRLQLYSRSRCALRLEGWCALPKALSLLGTIVPNINTIQVTVAVNSPSLAGESPVRVAGWRPGYRLRLGLETGLIEPQCRTTLKGSYRASAA